MTSQFDLSSKAKHFFVSVDVRLLDMRLPLTNQGVYIHLLRRAGKAGVCFESVASMAEHLRLKRNTICTVIRELEAMRLITVERSPGKRTHVSINDLDEALPKRLRIGAVFDRSEAESRGLTSTPLDTGSLRSSIPLDTPTSIPLDTPTSIPLDTAPTFYRSNRSPEIDPNKDPEFCTTPPPSTQSEGEGAGAPYRPVGRRVRVKIKQEVSESDKTLGLAWMTWAKVQCPTLVNATVSSFAEALADVRAKTNLSDLQLSQLFFFIKEDRFWARNAVSPRSLLKTGSNGLRKVDNIVTSMNATPNKGMVSDEKAKAVAESRARIEAARERVAARRAAEAAAKANGGKP